MTLTQDLRLTQELLGHSSPATTAIYAACDTTKATAAVAGLSVAGAGDLPGEWADTVEGGSHGPSQEQPAGPGRQT